MQKTASTLKSFLLFCFILGSYNKFALAIECEKATFAITPPNAPVYAGSPFNINLTINYPDNCIIEFDAQNQRWFPFTHVSHDRNEPNWIEQQWEQSVSITLLAPPTGQYAIPTLALVADYGKPKPINLDESLLISVKSAFSDENIRLQEVLAIPENNPNKRFPIVYIALILFCFSIFLGSLYWIYKAIKGNTNVI